MRHQPRALTSTEEMRLFAGLAVQPFWTAIVAFFSFPLLLLDRAGQTLAGGVPADPTAAAISVALGTGFVAVVVTLVGVAPAALWIVKRRPLTLAQSLFFGFAFANVPVVIGAVSAGVYGVSGALRAVTFASLIGISGAGVFWGVSIRGRDFSRDQETG